MDFDESEGSEGMRPRRACVWFLAVILALTGGQIVDAQTDPLPSWNDGPAKQSIVKFVQAVTESGGAQYVAPEQRIGTFDNDGTLWSEQPIYFQFAFALDRVRALAPKHPEWKAKQPFKGILERDMKAVMATGEKDCRRSWRPRTAA